MGDVGANGVKTCRIVRRRSVMGDLGVDIDEAE